MVHRTVEAEGPAAACGRDRGGDQRIAWCGAQSLAETVQETQQQDEGPAQRKADGRACQARRAVARENEALGADTPVSQPPGNDLEHARRGLCDALDKADDGGAGAEGRGEEQRQQRSDHFAGRVVGERHQPEHHDRPRQGRGRVARAHRPPVPFTV